MKTHSYEETLGRKQDFEVAYVLLGADADRSRVNLLQGSRPNWQFTHDILGGGRPGNVQIGIAPEFLTADGERWPDGVPPMLNGTAKVWIRFEAMRARMGPLFHVGVQGYFTDGMSLLAECTVTRVVALRE